MKTFSEYYSGSTTIIHRLPLVSQCLWGLVVVGTLTAANEPFKSSINTISDFGFQIWPCVVNGIYQLESKNQLTEQWQTFPAPGAVLVTSSTQLAVAVSITRAQEFFRGVYLGVTNRGTNFSTSFNSACSFQRASASIDVLTGQVAATNLSNSWTVEFPVWKDGAGFRRVGGTNFILGVNHGGTLFGTPSKLGQNAMYVSTDEGSHWNYCTSLPVRNTNDHIVRVNSVCFGTNELLVASVAQGGLFISTNQGATFSINLLPDWYSVLGPNTAFNGNVLVEAVLGRSTSDCRLLICLYGQRLEGSQKIGCVYVFRTDVSLAQMAGGVTPQLQLVWKQDAFDFYGRYVSGAIAVTNHIGFVSATSTTLTDAAGIFGANDTSRPRCVRIVGGTGAGQSRMIVSNTTNTLTLYTPWQVLPDATSDYTVINGMKSGGMHLHCAAWVPQSGNGESNVLFISFGDSTSGHVCRIPNFDQLATKVAAEDYSGWGWNYSDSQVFAIGHQPTTMWPTGGGQLCFVARDYNDVPLITPDYVFSPQFNFQDSFNAAASPYLGMGYDAVVHAGIATIAQRTDGPIGQYGILVGAPASLQQLFRFVRGLNPVVTNIHVGYSFVYGSPQSDLTVITGDNFGSGYITNTWLVNQPTFTNIQTVLVANAATNLIVNAGFSTTNGVNPTGWYQSSGLRPASSMVASNDAVYGTGAFWQIGQTNTANITINAASPALANFSNDMPLCLSYAYRLPTLLFTTYSAPASFRVEWRGSSNQILRIDSSKGLNQTFTNQWLVEHFSAMPPTNATQASVEFAYKNYIGAIDVSMPMASWGRFAVPTVTPRSADILEYNLSSTNWNGYPSSYVDFLAFPLWPTDINPYATETICTILSSDSTRFRLTWDYNRGFQAIFQNQLGGTLVTMNLGQLRTLTRVDPCRFSVDFRRGLLTVKLDAGGDVLQATAAISGITVFNPVKIRLGSDQFNAASLGWEGYYALLSCHGSN